ncbi:hypothetical protein P7K49_024623 [Saguinus oedipus]|uniref:Uncharacterized protein n=1 Tax=Saguinus oedipus TaxID=9490 RepID=A0ABQ9USB3_SAGOE|nr:hypothetical protein P7K49_024623 [Saguinus oedipus]
MTFPTGQELLLRVAMEAKQGSSYTTQLGEDSRPPCSSRLKKSSRPGKGSQQSQYQHRALTDRKLNCEIHSNPLLHRALADLLPQFLNCPVQPAHHRLRLGSSKSEHDDTHLTHVEYLQNQSYTSCESQIALSLELLSRQLTVPPDFLSPCRGADTRLEPALKGSRNPCFYKAASEGEGPGAWAIPTRRSWLPKALPEQAAMQ